MPAERIAVVPALLDSSFLIDLEREIESGVAGPALAWLRKNRTLAQRPRAGSVVYSASKGGVEAFSRAIAVELARHSVRVNCVAPGLVRSDIYLAAGMPAGAYDVMVRARASEIPLKRVGEPVDVAGLVAYLGSEAASWMTGVCIPLDGGGMLR